MFDVVDRDLAAWEGAEELNFLADEYAREKAVEKRAELETDPEALCNEFFASDIIAEMSSEDVGAAFIAALAGDAEPMRVLLSDIISRAVGE